MKIIGEDIFFEWKIVKTLDPKHYQTFMAIVIEKDHFESEIAIEKLALQKMVAEWGRVIRDEKDSYQSDFKDSPLSCNLKREEEDFYLAIDITNRIIETDPTTTIGIDLGSLDSKEENAKAENVDGKIYSLEVSLEQSEVEGFITDLTEQMG